MLPIQEYLRRFSQTLRTSYFIKLEEDSRIGVELQMTVYLTANCRLRSLGERLACKCLKITRFTDLQITQYKYSEHVLTHYNQIQIEMAFQFEDRRRLQIHPDSAQTISLSTLTQLFDIYLRRQNQEDIQYLKTTLKLESLEGILKTDFYNGIPDSEQDRNERAEQYGTNKIVTTRVKNFCQFLWDALNDFMLKLLLFSAALSIAANLFIQRKHMDVGKFGITIIAWLEGFAILLAVAVVSLVGAISDWRRQLEFKKMNELSESKKTVCVIRGGVERVLHQGQLLVGDVVKIEPGLKIPVDGVILRSNGVQIDESSMTGESRLIKKADLERCEEIVARENEMRLSPHSTAPYDAPSPVLLSGTTVNNGDGYFVVLVVGTNTVAGKIQRAIFIENEPTPLQQKLEVLGKQVGKVREPVNIQIGFVVGALIFGILVARYLIEESNGPEGLTWKNQHLAYCLRCFTVGITIIVVAVPEGLPMAVAISLAFSVSKMVADKTFVKKLKSCEQMGSVTVICSDKTGTLTQNEMNITKLWMGREVSYSSKFKIDVPAQGKIPSDCWYNPQFKQLIVEGLACNATSTQNRVNSSQPPLFTFLKNQGISVDLIQNECFSERIIRYLFTSRRKRMSTVLLKSRQGLGPRIHMKGAAQYIIQRCNWYIDSEGNRVPLTQKFKEKQFTKIIEGFGKRALRVICLAYKEIDPQYGFEDEHQSDPAIEEEGFTCLVILGLKDPLRPFVPQALQECKKSGIRVIMVTGDNAITALEIAKECGLVEAESGGRKVQMNGAQFYEAVGELLGDLNTGNLDDFESARHRNIEEFARITQDLVVLSRARPHDKYLLVHGLKLMNEIVAVTGDGTNDAPALIKAHVGLAMGIRGTGVAKEAAGMIILDDNFHSVVNAVSWGRNIYDNIKRFLQFQLTANLVTLIVTFVDSCVIEDSVLTPMQLLWVNLMMDSLASLALATDPPTETTLNSRPVDPAQSIVTSSMKAHIVLQSIYQCLVIFVLVFLGEYFIPEQCTTLPQNSHNCNLIYSARADNYTDQMRGEYGPSRHFTVVFNALVWMQLFNEINSRKIKNELNVCSGLSRNILFLGVWISTAFAQVMLVEFSGHLFSVSRTGLSERQWLLCIALGLGSLAVRFFALSLYKVCCRGRDNESEISLRDY